MYHALKDSEYITLRSIVEIIIKYENQDVSSKNNLVIVSCKILKFKLDIVCSDNSVFQILLLDFALWYKRHYKDLTDSETDAFLAFLMEYSSLDADSFKLIVESTYDSCTEMKIDIEYITVLRAIGSMFLIHPNIDTLKSVYVVMDKVTKIICRYSEDDKVVYIENTDTEDVFKVMSDCNYMSIQLHDILYDDISGIMVALETSTKILFVTIGGTPLIAQDDITFKKLKKSKRILLLEKIKYIDEFEILN